MRVPLGILDGRQPVTTVRWTTPTLALLITTDSALMKRTSPTENNTTNTGFPDYGPS